VVEGLVLGQVGVDTANHGRVEFLGAEAIATSNDGWHTSFERKLAVALSFKESVDNVEVERFARGTRFLGTVENGDLLNGLRKSGDEFFTRERTIEADLEDTDLSAFVLDHGFDGFVNGFTARAHEDDDVRCVRSADVVDQVVRAASGGSELIHGALNDGRDLLVELVAYFAALEVDVRVLGGTANNRVFRVETVVVASFDPSLVDHAVQGVIRDVSDFANFVRRAETVKEIDERNAGFQGSGVGDSGEVGSFLSGRTAKHGPATGADAHYVGVVTEDGEGLSSERTGGNVEDARCEFTSDLVHVGDHQEQPLRSSEGCSQGSSLKSTVDSTSGTSFTLKFND
jgi:hypothetical protein